MANEKLIATLADLAANRRLGLEASSVLKPFLGEQYTLRFEFGSAERTFGNRLDSSYEGGKTVTCKLEGIEVSVLLLPTENDKVKSLKAGDELEAKVTPLEFDSLYQRAILGQVPEESAESESNEEPSSESEQAVPEDTTPEPTQAKKPEAPTEPAKPAPAPEPAKPTPAPEPAKPTPEPEPAKPTPEPEPAKPTPEPEPVKPERPKPQTPATPPQKEESPKFRIEAGPTRDSTKKPRRKKIPRAKHAPSRASRFRKPSLLKIKKAIGKKIKPLKRMGSKLRPLRRITPCPKGHGPLTYTYRGKRYCKTCGWPGRINSLGNVTPSETTADARNKIEGCWQFGCVIFVLMIVISIFLSIIT